MSKHIEEADGFVTYLIPSSVLFFD